MRKVQMRWALAVQMPDDGQPRFLQIARAIVDDVKRGRLKPGAALPGSRTLAESLGVHRNTVLAAYDELAAEGWIVREPARGTFVSTALPDARPRQFAPGGRSGMPERAGFDLPPSPENLADRRSPAGCLSLAGGVPDMRLAPAVALARAF